MISVFWSFMADLFDTAQARRLYGFIAAGGTAGALVGPSITSQLVKVVGPNGLVLISAALLGLTIVAILRLRAWAGDTRATEAAEGPRPDTEAPLGGSLWSGLVDVVRTPYLLAICGFLLAYALLSTFLYFQTAKEFLPRAVTDSAARTQLLARFDLAVNVAALLLQLAAFPRLMRRFGTRAVLAALPLVSVVGFVVFAVDHTLPVLLAFGLVRRSGEYALSKPGRETLFNVLSTEQKYRAKNVIDTLVHRTGDVASASIYTALRSAGLSSSGISWLSVPIAGAWLAVALWLGTQARRQEAAAPPPPLPG